MNIDEVFSTEQRVKILRHVLFETDPIYVNDIARKTGTSKGLVSKYLNQLLAEDVLEEYDRGFRVKEGTATKGLKILLTLDRINLRILANYPFIKSVGVYGSVVKGMNTKESDIDLWILHDPASPEQLAKVTKTLSHIGNITPLYLTKEKLEQMKTQDTVFYYSLFFGSITMYGEGLDTI